MKVKNIVLLVGIFLLLIGCGGGSSSSNSTTTNNNDPIVNTYTVVDPYIEGARFFWDKNGNDAQDSDEPLSNSSDENGNFTFDSSVTIPEGAKLVMHEDHKGEHNGISYTGKLEAVISSTKVISPLTTYKVKNPNVVSILSQAGITISEDDIDKDPMKSNSPNHIVSSIALDLYLKLLEISDIDKTQISLSDIVKLVQYLILQDISNENIQNSVSIVDYVTNKIKEDKNFEEFTKLLNNTNGYRDIAKSILKNRANKNKPGYLRSISENATVEEAKKNSRTLDKISYAFASSPIKNIENNISLNIDSFPSGYSVSWSVESEPSTSSLNLTISSNLKMATFTPTIVGEYKIMVTVSNSSNLSEKLIKFTVNENYRVDDDKIEGFDADTNKSTHIGVVTNQTWIASSSLSETQLSEVIAKKKTLVKLGYDRTGGVLVEYDNNDTSTLEDIEELKYEDGIDNVYSRVYIGKDAVKVIPPLAVEPNDNGGFNDGGDNWHLEAINMPEAWEYTKGTDDFFIGVIDSGFDNLHSDMQGRFATFLTNDKGDHGMGVAGSIAANTNNGFGISGINWNTNVVASGLHYTSDIENVLDTTINGKKTKLLTNSWGLEYIPGNFNPTNSSMANARFDRMQSILGWIRQIVSTRSDKLFLWAAGNGVGNGASSTGYYGVDSKYDNGAMAYKNGVLSKLDNLLLVSAFVKSGDENVLVYYSNYGESVDIAAPTHFKSLKLNNQYYSTGVGFSGTSAATPVAAAVTSLIYSINPDLTPADVKSILVNSATEFITKKQTNPYGAMENLARPIPILDAEAALKAACETTSNCGSDDGGNENNETGDASVNFVAEISDYFTPKASFRYYSYDKNYKVTAVSTTLKSSSTQGSYGNYSTSSANSDVIELTLDSSKRFHQLTSTVTLQHILTQETTTATSVRPFTYSDLTIKTVKFADQSNLPTTDFNASYSTIFKNYGFGNTTDASAIKKVYLPYGFFKLTGKKEGYRDAKQTISTTEAKSYFIDLPFGSSVDGEAGAITGIVLDENGAAIEGATVAISDGNKPIKETTTDVNGNYSLWNISKRDNSNNLISNFKLKASKTDYGEVLKQNVIVLDSINRVENFTLIKVPDNVFPTAIAGDDIENIFKTNKYLSGYDSYDTINGSPVKLISKYVWTEDGVELNNSPHYNIVDLSIGVHNIVLTVTDGDGATASDTVQVTVIAEPTYSWEAGEWGECTGVCGTTSTQTREILCKSSIGNATVDASKCDGIAEPIKEQSCSTAECPFEFNEITSPITGRIWIDRNLGAKKVCDKSRSEFNTAAEYITSQEDCFGDYYQWGRSTDGHQKTNSELTSVVSNKMPTGHTKFILASTNYNYDWTSLDENGITRSNSWSNIKGDSICPTGYRVPTLVEMQEEKVTTLADAYTNLKLPVSGLRSAASDGVYSNKGVYGILWLSTSKEIDEIYSTIYFKYTENDFAYGSGKRSFGYTVRCIKPTEQETNNPPIADAGNDQTVIEGQSVTLSGSSSTDSDGEIVKYEWKEGTTLLSSGDSFTSTTFSVGLHVITLIVTDDDNATDTDTALINITSSGTDLTYSWETSSWSTCAGACGTNNAIQTRTVVCKNSLGSTVGDNLCTGTKPATSQSCTESACDIANKAPVANAGSNLTLIVGESTTLDGTGSYDLDGSIVTYAWTGGDISSAYSSDKYTTSALAVGTYTYTLEVTDNEGLTDTDIVIITVIEKASYNWQVTAWSNCSVTCGDGTKTRTARCLDNASVEVADSYCEEISTKPETSASCNLGTCEVENKAPIANAGTPQTITYGSTVTLDGSGSIDSDGYIVSYSWTLNNIAKSTSKSFTLALLDEGTHTLTLTVTDNHGATDTDQVTITVNAPVTFYWKIGEWSECNGDCGEGNGTQTREVICQSSVGSTVDDSVCTTSKPSTSQTCTASLCAVDDNDTITSTVTGRIWMNKNLGASRVCTTMYDTQCFGDYYQWGRGRDGHEKTTSINTNAVATSIENAGTEFILGVEAYDYDWLINKDNSGEIRAEKFSNITQSTSLTCPDGFRVPTQGELIAENISNASVAFNNLKLPLSGERSYSDGNLIGQNEYGHIWSSSSNGSFSMYLSYDSKFADWFYQSRANGKPIRCIKQ